MVYLYWTDFLSKAKFSLIFITCTFIPLFGSKILVVICHLPCAEPGRTPPEPGLAVPGLDDEGLPILEPGLPALDPGLNILELGLHKPLLVYGRLICCFRAVPGRYPVVGRTAVPGRKPEGTKTPQWLWVCGYVVCCGATYNIQHTITCPQ